MESDGPTHGRTTLVVKSLSRLKNQVNCQLSGYPYIKDVEIEWKYFQDGIFCHFLASMFSGLVTTIASMPVDIAKTRLQNQKIIDGKKCFLILKIIKRPFSRQTRV